MELCYSLQFLYLPLQYPALAASPHLRAPLVTTLGPPAPGPPMGPRPPRGPTPRPSSPGSRASSGPSTWGCRGAGVQAVVELYGVVH